MSPSALALAALVHGAAALALWWMAQHPPRLPANPEVVDVTFEQPVKPPPVAKALPSESKPLPPLLGIPPPAAITADKATQVPPKAPELAPQKPMETLPQEAPSLEQTLPPPQAEPPAPSDNAFAVPKPATPAQPTPPAKAAAARPNPPSQNQIRSSPLTPGTQRRPPAVARGEEASASPFVNPADVYNRARVGDNYRWQIVRKLANYRFKADVPVREGVTVVRIVVARDGRLLNIAVVRSSGFPTIDQGVVAGVRSGSPYDPLPPEIKGDTATFDLPLVAYYR